MILPESVTVHAAFGQDHPLRYGRLVSAIIRRRPGTHDRARTGPIGNDRKEEAPE